jgi:hypothetical protein
MWQQRWENVLVQTIGKIDKSSLHTINNVSEYCGDITINMRANENEFIASPTYMEK